MQNPTANNVSTSARDARKSSTAVRSESNWAVVVLAAPANPDCLPASSNSSATPASAPRG